MAHRLLLNLLRGRRFESLWLYGPMTLIFKLPIFQVCLVAIPLAMGEGQHRDDIRISMNILQPLENV